jgi:hypothetical protein
MVAGFKLDADLQVDHLHRRVTLDLPSAENYGFRFEAIAKFNLQGNRSAMFKKLASSISVKRSISFAA